MGGGEWRGGGGGVEVRERGNTPQHRAKQLCAAQKGIMLENLWSSTGD